MTGYIMPHINGEAASACLLLFSAYLIMTTQTARDDWMKPKRNAHIAGPKTYKAEPLNKE